MGKTIIHRVVGEAAELIKDTGKEAAKQAKEIAKGLGATAFGDLHKVTPGRLEELQNEEKKVKGANIGALKRELALEAQARQQMAAETQTRRQAQSSQGPKQRSMEQVALPVSTKKQFGIAGLGHKKASTVLAPIKPKPSSMSSIETKYAGRD